MTLAKPHLTRLLARTTVGGGRDRQPGREKDQRAPAEAARSGQDPGRVARVSRAPGGSPSPRRRKAGEAGAEGRVVRERDNSDLAELVVAAPGRNRGLYTALVAAWLKEAIQRGRKYMFVDALPTSEPILRKRGFQRLTDTQSFIYAPAA
jgi:hypothetical protein